MFVLYYIVGFRSIVTSRIGFNSQYVQARFGRFNEWKALLGYLVSRFNYSFLYSLQVFGCA
uniref:Uncharacterized protein n=1 Tax=Utricularia reniformis TaxID=192314 RepID=A0A1Y0B353_9LAMI|nr:hypothetical protein AEK19_MT1633 [Utricularia reniformis]ART31817.1 hypothetical protein AEK19_MT1633 [Utricularia reniformis]